MDFLNTSETDGLILKLLNINLRFQGLNKVFENKYGLSIVQWAFLKALLQMPAVSPQVLAKTLQVTPGTLSQTMARLQKRKFIFVCNDPKDARKKMISLTRVGKELLDSVDQHYEFVFAPIKSVKREVGAVASFMKQTAEVISEGVFSGQETTT